MSSIRMKMHAISKWLKFNSEIQTEGDGLDIDERTALAKYYVEYFGDKIHGVRIYNGGAEFHLRVGCPRFRGTVNYKLHSHSLRFRSENPGYVMMVLSGDLQPSSYEGGVKQNLITSDIDRGRMSDMWHNGFTKFACHPHISHTGEPCLGGWGMAWAECVSKSNIISLVQVAKCFLNTWTANDAFFNINGYRRTWLRIPSTITKFYPFRDWVVIQEFWIWVKSNLSGDAIQLSPHHFTDWLRENEHSVLAYIHESNYDEQCIINLHMNWCGLVATKKQVNDTRDGHIKAMKAWGSTGYSLYDYVQARLANDHNIRDDYAWALAADALETGFALEPRIYHPQRYRGTTNYPFREIQRLTDSISSYTSSNQVNVNWADIFEFSRAVRRGNHVFQETYLSLEQLKDRWRSWFMDRYFRDTFWTSLNSSIHYANLVSPPDYPKYRLFNREDFKIEFDDIDEELLDDVFTTMLHMRIVADSDDVPFMEMSMQVDYYLNNALGLYLTKMKQYTKELEHGKERYETAVQDFNRRNDSSEDTISVEAF
jgi:hypothetical protein